MVVALLLTKLVLRKEKYMFMCAKQNICPFLLILDCKEGYDKEYHLISGSFFTIIDLQHSFAAHCASEHTDENLHGSSTYSDIHHTKITNFHPITREKCIFVYPLVKLV